MMNCSVDRPNPVYARPPAEKIVLEVSPQEAIYILAAIGGSVGNGGTNDIIKAVNQYQVKAVNALDRHKLEPVETSVRRGIIYMKLKEAIRQAIVVD